MVSNFVSSKVRVRLVRYGVHRPQRLKNHSDLGKFGEDFWREPSESSEVQPCPFPQVLRERASMQPLRELRMSL